MNTEPTHKDVYAIIPATKEGKPDYWHRVGTAFVNRDLSLPIRLNSLPLDGRLVLRDARPISPPSP